MYGHTECPRADKSSSPDPRLLGFVSAWRGNGRCAATSEDLVHLTSTTSYGTSVPGISRAGHAVSLEDRLHETIACMRRTLAA